MKKGFTMIELIFVIVILGILASVAIPRLAGTREDAEISTAVSNLRTLLGDAASYYVVKGSFGTANWKEFTNVPLAVANSATQAVGTAATANLKVGDVTECIGVYIVEKNGDTPAYIKFIPKAAPAQNAAKNVCDNVIASAPVQAYINSTVKDGANTVDHAMAIGSNTSIYKQNTQPAAP